MTTASQAALNLDELLVVMKAAAPPWEPYRGRYQLHRTEWLPDTLSIVKLDTMVLVQESAYHQIQRMDWGPFGPPKDAELAAMLAHRIDNQ